MSRKRIRRGMRPAVMAPRVSASRSGLDRVSCGWRDAVGPGYVTGVTPGMAQMLAALDSGRYCR